MAEEPKSSGQALHKSTSDILDTKLPLSALNNEAEVFPGIPLFRDDDASLTSRNKRRSEHQIQRAVSEWAGANESSSVPTSPSKQPRRAFTRPATRLSSHGTLPLGKKSSAPPPEPASPFPGIPVFSEDDINVKTRERARSQFKIDRALEAWAGAPVEPLPMREQASGSRRRRKKQYSKSRTLPELGTSLPSTPGASEPFPGIPIFSEQHTSLEGRERVRCERKIEQTIEAWAGHSEERPEDTNKARPFGHLRANSLGIRRRKKGIGGTAPMTDEAFPGIILYSEEHSTPEQRTEVKFHKRIEKSVEEWAGAPVDDHTSKRSSRSQKRRSRGAQRKNENM